MAFEWLYPQVLYRINRIMIVNNWAEWGVNSSRQTSGLDLGEQEDSSRPHPAARSVAALS